jgi:hypothetical protein
VFLAQVDSSSSRAASPIRTTNSDTNPTPTAENSILSCSTQNQPLRFYYQALSGLLARLDAGGSFGHEGVQQRRKEGALDEVERGVEGRWRRWVWGEEGCGVGPTAVTARRVCSIIAHAWRALDLVTAPEEAPRVAESAISESIPPAIGIPDAPSDIDATSPASFGADEAVLQKPRKRMRGEVHAWSSIAHTQPSFAAHCDLFFIYDILTLCTYQRGLK